MFVAFHIELQKHLIKWLVCGPWTKSTRTRTQNALSTAAFSPLYVFTKAVWKSYRCGPIFTAGVPESTAAVGCWPMEVSIQNVWVLEMLPLSDFVFPLVYALASTYPPNFQAWAHVQIRATIQQRKSSDYLTTIW